MKINMTQSRLISTTTFAFARIIGGLQAVIIEAENLKRESNVTPLVRNMMNSIINRCNGGVSEITRHLKPESRHCVMSEIKTDEFALRNVSLSNMILALPPGVQDEIESYVKARYDLFIRNSPR